MVQTRRLSSRLVDEQYVISSGLRLEDENAKNSKCPGLNRPANELAYESYMICWTSLFCMYQLDRVDEPTESNEAMAMSNRVMLKGLSNSLAVT